MELKLRPHLFSAVIALAALFSSTTLAQDPVQAELAALRKIIEQQNNKIDDLAVQIAKLNARLDPAGQIQTAPAGRETPTPPRSDSTPPVPRVIADPSKVHIVVKGDSLEKIAKQYATTVAELQKLNSISDPKKLQIGQQLTLPPEKKDQQ